MNKRFLLSLFLIIFSSSAFSCGEYYTAAQVVMKDGLSTLVINPDTKSEINLKVEFNESGKLSPYLNRFIEAKVQIEEKMDFTRGVVSHIDDIKVIVPDPLAQAKGTKLTLLKKADCKKKQQ